MKYLNVFFLFCILFCSAAMSLNDAGFAGSGPERRSNQRARSIQSRAVTPEMLKAYNEVSTAIAQNSVVDLSPGIIAYSGMVFKSTNRFESLKNATALMKPFVPRNYAANQSNGSGLIYEGRNAVTFKKIQLRLTTENDPKSYKIKAWLMHIENAVYLYFELVKKNNLPALIVPAIDLVLEQAEWVGINDVIDEMIFDMNKKL